MNDLDLAMNRLNQNNLSMVFVRKGKIIFESNTNGLSPFIQSINKHFQDIKESTLADKVVGKAAALLVIYAKINSVFASILSLEAAKILEHNRIPYKYDKMVDRIVNRQGTDLCPFEKKVLATSNPTEAFQCIEEMIRLLETGQ
ncbi:MAG: DUF1893 domain-containing protein [Nitrososphaerales archaeon]|nr:DUF1893 domain-containing protein [Nitrososphaerales archaeon]